MTKQIKYLVTSVIALPLLVLAYFKIKSSIKPQGEGAINDTAVRDVRTKFNLKRETASKVVDYANRLAHDLGTKFDWYDPRRWSENDKESFDLVMNTLKPQRLMRETAFAYVLVTKGRSLKNDLYTLLDERYIKKLDI